MDELHNLTLRVATKDELNCLPEFSGEDVKGVHLKAVLVKEGMTGRGRTGVAMHRFNDNPDEP